MAEYEIQLITIAPSEPKIRNKASAFRLTCSVPRSDIVTLQVVFCDACGYPKRAALYMENRIRQALGSGSVSAYRVYQGLA
jgi:hypothetical protein